MWGDEQQTQTETHIYKHTHNGRDWTGRIDGQTILIEFYLTTWKITLKLLERRGKEGSVKEAPQVNFRNVLLSQYINTSPFSFKRWWYVHKCQFFQSQQNNSSSIKEIIEKISNPMKGCREIDSINGSFF